MRQKRLKKFGVKRDLTELRLSMFVRSQSHDVKHSEMLQESFFRPESNEESRSTCCEQVGCRNAVFVEQLESVIHEAPSLEQVGAKFGPSERQRRVEASCRRKSWASLASEEEREVGKLEGQPPQHVQPIVPRPDDVRFAAGTRFAGTRFAGQRSGLVEKSQLVFGKLVSCRSPIFWTARPNGHLEKSPAVL